MTTEVNVKEAFKKSCENFESTSKILVKGLDPQNIINLFAYLIPSEKAGSKFTELQIHFSTVSQQMNFDFIKAVITLCQGHLADHYFYKRRSVEYLQLYAFLASSDNSKELCQEYLNTDSTSKFKDKRYKKWFNEEKSIFKSRFPLLIQAYDNACKYGTHAGISNQQISQFWTKKEDGLFCMVNYFDLASDGFEINPLETALIQVFRLYNEIFMAIYYYKLTPYPFPQSMYDSFCSQFKPYFESYRAYLIKNHPAYTEKVIKGHGGT